MTKSPVGRLAPSPTGSQHLGNARTYLIAWLYARSRGGTVRLRIEDIDAVRNKPGSAEQAVNDIRRLGLDWSGELVIQSHRLAAHEQALEQLKTLELVYPCTCTRSDIATAASAPHLDHEAPTYPGTCAGRTATDAAKLDIPFAWRFRVTESPEFVDRFLGPVQIDLLKAGGDFVVWRSVGSPAYQLAVVVDDAAAEVTEVVRGDDLISSTPRQLLLYRALNLVPPEYVHVPLVIGPDGRRLAKRHGDTRIDRLLAEGVSGAAIVGLLAWSCGWISKPEPVEAKELIPHFDLAALPREPFVLTPEMVAALA